MIQADEAQQQQGRQKVNRPIAPKRTVSERRRAKALKQRWIVLTLLCIIPLGSHFVRKELGPLKTAMLGDGVFGLNNTRFAMLLSATALPNLMVPVFGGALLDIRGSRWGTMLFLVLTLIGQILFTLAAHLRWFAGAILAQVVVGIGAGSTVVSQAAISSEYFERTEMGFAIGVLESAHNLSNWLGQALPAQIMASFNASFVTSLCFGVATCALSLVAGILYVRTDIYAEAVSDKIRPLKSDIGSIGELQTQNGICQLATEMTLSLPLSFYGLALLHMLFSTAHESFDNLSANLLTVRYGDSAVDAGLLASIDNVFGLVLAPFVGIFLDKVGYRLHFLCIMSLLLAFAQAILAFAIVPNPIISLIILGFVNSSVPTILRSSVPLVVDPSEWGMAFGVFEASEAFGTFIGNLAAGMIRDWTSTYAWVNVGFMSSGIICFIASLILAYSRSTASHKLAAPLEGDSYCLNRSNAEKEDCEEADSFLHRSALGQEPDSYGSMDSTALFPDVKL